MTMTVSDIETQDLLKSIDAKLCSIVTIMAKNANVAENGKSSKMEQDAYNEQRKWIGKLCFFWGNNKEDTCYAILGDIIEYTDTPFEAKDYALWYEHCEPVKPDDDIIYKGDK